MMDITVKTLDGQNRAFSVPENITVKQFKEKIANSINISADTQRLIFQGKVLQDDKLMKDYDVHGKVVHVVVRPPPSANRPAGQPDNPQPNTTTPGRDVNSIVVGSFTLPSDLLDANMVQGIAQDAIRSMGDMGRNARVTTRTSSDGSALDVHIHLGPMQSGRTMSEAQMRLNTARTMIRLATDSLDRLERASPGSGSQSGTPRSSSPSPGREGETESVPSSSDSPTVPSPMDTTEEPSSTQQPDSESADIDSEVGSTQTSSGADASTNQSEATTSTDQSGPDTTGEQTDQNQQPRGPVRPNITALADVLSEFSEVNQRLQPHLQRFTEIVREDAEMSAQEQRDNQRVCNHVTEVMHAFSHGYHALSDLMVDLSQNRPRQLYVTLAIAHPHTTVIQQAIPVQIAVPIARTRTNTSTTSTGTSTNPGPRTTETGTQPNRTSTTETGTQPAGNGAAGTRGQGDDLERISQEMRAGLQNVLGQNVHQGDGSPDNPYVFVEMGPDRMTVNSISAHVMEEIEGEEEDIEIGDFRPPTTTSTTQAGAPTSTTTTGPQAQMAQGLSQGLSQAGLPQNLIQGIMQQVLQQSGQGGNPPQRMQINIEQGPGPMPRPGVPMGIRLGPQMMRTGSVRTDATQTAGSNGVPANSGTQTSATPTSTFGTQTTSNSTPSSTSGTQTPPGAPFILPGGIPIPGLPGTLPGAIPGSLPGELPPGIQRHLQGNLPGGLGLNPADPYLPCSSRHFLTRHATSILNNNNGNPQQQNSDTVLADMVGNLMSGLLGGATGTGSTPTSATTSTPSTAGTSPGTRPTGASAQPRPTTGTNPPTFTSRARIAQSVTSESVNPGVSSSKPGSASTAPGTRPTGASAQPRPAAGTNPPTFTMGSAPGGGAPLFRGPFTMGSIGNLFPPGRMPTLTENPPTFTMGSAPGGGAPLFRGPFTMGSLGNLFPPGRMPTLTGMRFQVRTPRAPGQAPQARSTGTQPTTGTTTTTQAATSSTSTASTSEPGFVQMLRTMLQQSSQRPRTDTTQATSTTPSSTTSTRTDQNQNVQTGSAQPPISDEAFTQLVSGITNYMSQAAVGQAPAQTIGDFIRNLGENYSMPQGEGFINDVLSCILSNIQITDLLQLFYGNHAPLNQVQTPLREFLSTRVLENRPPTEENIRSGVVQLLKSMSQDIQDMVLFYGNHAQLNQVQTPLREFLSTRVLENRPPTDENIRSGVVQLLESMSSDIQDMVNTAAPRPHIDFLATTNRFLSQQFFNVIFLIMNSREGDANFGRDLYACMRRMMAEMFVLCSRCLGGMPLVERFVNQRLRGLIRDVNPVIQEWMSTVTSQQIGQFIPTIRVTAGEVGVYLVNKQPGQTTTTTSGSSSSASSSRASSTTAAGAAASTSTTAQKATDPKKKEIPPASDSDKKPSKDKAKRDPSPLRAPSPKRSSKEKEVVKSPTTPMETSPLISSPGASEMEVESHKSSSVPSRGAEASALSLPRSSRSRETENQPSPSGAQGSNGDWQSVVPADWVPVITRDIEAQKTQTKQPPYSDVYLQGMPPKRRRLMTQDRPANITNTSEVLSDSVRRAVAAAAVEPISSMDNLLTEINNDADLQQSFENQVTSTISDRLNGDTDFKEERFPGSNEYFHKTNGKKK